MQHRKRTDDRGAVSGQAGTSHLQNFVLKKRAAAQGTDLVQQPVMVCRNSVLLLGGAGKEVGEDGTGNVMPHREHSAGDGCQRIPVSYTHLTLPTTERV